MMYNFSRSYESLRRDFSTHFLWYWKRFNGEGLQDLQFLVSLLLQQVYWRFFEARLKWISRFIFTTVADFYRSTFKPHFESKRNLLNTKEIERRNKVRGRVDLDESFNKIDVLFSVFLLSENFDSSLFSVDFHFPPSFSSIVCFFNRELKQKFHFNNFS